MLEKSIQITRVNDERWFFQQLEQWQQAENISHGQMLKGYLEEVQKLFQKFQQQSQMLEKIRK